MAAFLAAAFFMLVHPCLQLSNKGPAALFPKLLLTLTAAQVMAYLSLYSSVLLGAQ